MSESDSSGSDGLSPGVVLVVLVVVAAIGMIVAGVVLFDIGGGDEGPTAPESVISISDAPAKYQSAEGFPTAVFLIQFQAGDPIPGDELRIEIRNRSSDELVARWEDGELTGGTAEDVILRIKRGKSASEETETFATSTAVERETITPGDSVEIVDVGAADFNTLTTYEIAVIHAPTGTTLRTGSSGIL